MISYYRLMSLQTQPAIVVSSAPRVRNENAQPIGGLGSGTKELLFTLGAIGVGAIGGYFIVDYIMKQKLLENLGDILPGSSTPAEEEKEEDKETKLAYIQPFDRYTRVSSHGAGEFASAYRGKKLPERLPVVDDIDSDEFEYEGDDVGFNQVFTQDRVYEVV